MLFFFRPNGEFDGLQSGETPDGVRDLRRRKILFVETTSGDDLDDSWYVPNPGAPYEELQIVRRPKAKISVSKRSIRADGVDETVISGLPDPATILIDGVAHEVAGGVLEFSADIRGLYEIRLDTWPYMPWAVTIRVGDMK